MRSRLCPSQRRSKLWRRVSRKSSSRSSLTIPSSRFHLREVVLQYVSSQISLGRKTLKTLGAMLRAYVNRLFEGSKDANASIVVGEIDSTNNIFPAFISYALLL